MIRPHGLLGLALLACSGCWSYDQANLAEISAKHGIELTEEDCPEGATPHAAIYVAKGGFYLFGYAPVVGVSLQETVEELALRAQKQGADGVCRIHYRLSPANPLKFLVFPIPDWSAAVEVDGMTFTRNGKALK